MHDSTHQASPEAATVVRLVTREQAAVILATTTRHIRRMAQDGRLPSLKIGGKQRFAAEDLSAFIMSSRQSGQAASGQPSL